MKKEYLLTKESQYKAQAGCIEPANPKLVYLNFNAWVTKRDKDVVFDQLTKELRSRVRAALNERIVRGSCFSSLIVDVNLKRNRLDVNIPSFMSIEVSYRQAGSARSPHDPEVRSELCQSVDIIAKTVRELNILDMYLTKQK